MGANVSVVAILILVAKIVSAVADPVVGNLVDRSKSKLGKFKSMIVYSIAPLLIFTAVVFVKVPFKGVGLYVWIFLTYLVWSIAMTMGDVPSQGIASVLTLTRQREQMLFLFQTRLSKSAFPLALLSCLSFALLFRTAQRYLLKA